MRFGVLALLLSLILCGCSGEPSADTMKRLRAGDPAVCADKAVKETLASLLRPKVDAKTDAAHADAIGKLHFDFELSTLEEFKKDVMKASCSTRATIALGNARLEKLPVVFEISPSAEDTSQFIVSVEQGLAAESIGNLVEQDVAAAAEARRKAEEAQAETARRDRVTGIATKKWLIGTWREYSPNWFGEFSCETDAYAFVDFERTGRFGEQNASGTWTLEQDRIGVKGTRFSDDGPSVPIEKTMIIWEADAKAQLLTLKADDGTVTTYRRCPKYVAPPSPPADTQAATPDNTVATGF